MSRTRRARGEIEEDLSRLVEQSNIKIKLPADQQEWTIYQNTAQRDVLFASHSYKKYEEELRESAERLPAGFQLIMYSDFVDDTKEHEYRAAVFINNETKEVVIANAGTRFGATKEGMHDLYNDVYLMMERQPPKVESIQALNDMLLDSLGEEAANYKFHYTGHSLGAALSDIGAADMALRCRLKGIPIKSKESTPEGLVEVNNISTMTFENPGAREIIRKMYVKAHKVNHNINYNTDINSDADYRGINNTVNLINQTSSHVGRMYEMNEDRVEENRNGFQKFCGYLGKKVENFSSALGSVLHIISFGKVSRQMDSHKLEHFDKALVKQETNVIISKPEIKEHRSSIILGVIKRGVEILWDNKIVDKLLGRKNEYGDVGKQKFYMCKEDQVVTASALELKSAVIEVEKAAQKTVVTSNIGKSFVSREEDKRKKLEVTNEKNASILPSARGALGMNRGRSASV